MKNQKNLNRLLVLSLIAFIHLTVNFELLAQDKRSAELKDFTIQIEKTSNGIQMKSVEGSAWMDLSFSLIDDKPQAIDEYGMTELDNVSPAKDDNLVDYLFTITKTKNEIVLKGIEGTAWKELSFTLANNVKQTIDQFGMSK